MFYIRYIKMIMQTLPIIGSCRFGNGQGRYSLEGPGAPPTTGRHSRILLLMGTHIYIGPIFVVPNLVSGGC